jgi:hypothetical protein
MTARVKKLLEERWEVAGKPLAEVRHGTAEFRDF